MKNILQLSSRYQEVRSICSLSEAETNSTTKPTLLPHFDRLSMPRSVSAMAIMLYCVFLIFNSPQAQAQITYMFTQDTGSLIGLMSGVPSPSQLMVINFEASGEKYVNVNRLGNNISIYNIMNHALEKTISIANVPVGSGGVSDILYLSEHLFNTDNKIEFMTSCTSCSNGDTYYTGIYNEDGTLLFSDTAFPAVRPNFPLQQYPIYNTSNGTIMILSYRNGQAKVFGLAGTLTTAIYRNSHAFAGNMGNAYPNPTASASTIPYTLPQGSNSGEVVFYNTSGSEVKRFKVDNTFNDLQITTSDIPAGTYYYQLQVAGNASGAKKLVVVK